ncbi:MAG: helix-turn-helix domain-containing protein [Gammaproteobacteria bacterium]|jgi:Bacteriophage CI repressor helix-turn-helix domain
MDLFGAALLRLKQQAGVQHDKEVAELLGMTDKALNARKARGAFPEDKLFALAARRPDLNIDPNYVLHGPDATKVMAEQAAGWVAGLPARLRAVRGKRSVPAFAKLLGLKADDVGRLEEGLIKPNYELLDRYSKISPEFSLAWLISGERLQLDEPLSDEEVILVRNYRLASLEGQEAIKRAAAFHREFAARPERAKP